MSVVNNVSNFVEEHPYGTGAIVFVIGVIIIMAMMRRNASTTPAAGGQATGLADAQALSVQASTSLAAAQLQAQSANNAINAAVTKDQQDNATAVQLATLSAQSQQNAAKSAADAMSAYYKSKITSDLVSTLSAQLGGLGETSGNAPGVNPVSHAEGQSGQVMRSVSGYFGDQPFAINVGQEDNSTWFAMYNQMIAHPDLFQMTRGVDFNQPGEQMVISPAKPAIFTSIDPVAQVSAA
jgi:hypothetical protein